MAVLVGKKAPDFKVKAVINGHEIVDDFSLSQYHGEKYVLLFFYPKDFTFVCPTELHAFQTHLQEFEERNVAVIGCSTDTEYSHAAWLQLSGKQGGINGITYPLIADTNKTISSDYDVLAGEYVEDEKGQVVVAGELVAYRGLFLIDREGIVQHQLVNNMPLGRSIKEALRMVDTLQHFEKHGEVCPANWEKGKEAMKATLDSVSNYLENSPQFADRK
ncbi:MAG TPA: peroxiredoxin [Verrucomicrobiales bacterium]|nr:peroxiredoxin [Verrucomicrobiales bacterium]HIL72473.1 peroxiredoxin [Verrucomicrobiota bacterium]